jgi:hypothetical protein
MVSPGVEQCPHCGITFTSGTWRTPLLGLSNSRFGWGISPTARKSLAFRATCLLVPVWLPLVLAGLLGNQPGGVGGLVLLLAPFVFIPGVYVVANIPGWSAPRRLFASLTYVAVAGVVAFVALSTFVSYMNQL